MITRRTAIQSLAAASALVASPTILRAQAQTYRVGALNPITGAGSPTARECRR
jgi:hypothetical protein